MGKTKIEWADHNANVFKAVSADGRGHYCEKVSAGCANCYAERFQFRFGTQRSYDVRNRSEIQVEFDQKVIDGVLRRKQPTKYFWNTMTDTFLDLYPDEWIDRLYECWGQSPQHTHLILTKRSDRMQKYFADKVILPNVWLGVSVETDEQLRRIYDLSQTRAAVRFISAEPLLGFIDISPYAKFIDWVIVGGESGEGARPMHVGWAQWLRDQCLANDIKFFFKQWGEWISVPRGILHGSNSEFHIWNDGTLSFRVGKKRAGRKLDGVEHNDFPNNKLTI